MLICGMDVLVCGWEQKRKTIFVQGKHKKNNLNEENKGRFFN